MEGKNLPCTVFLKDGFHLQGLALYRALNGKTALFTTPADVISRSQYHKKVFHLIS